MGRYRLLLPLIALHSVMAAQSPLRHYTEAHDVRAGRSQPVLHYILRVDSTDQRGIRVELRIRNGPDTFQLAMVAHPEYDDRWWRFVENPAISGAPGAAIAAADSALWRVVAPGGTAAIQYRVTLPNDWQRREGWKPFLAPTAALIGGPHTLMYLVDATLVPAHVTLELPPGWDIATGLTRTSDPATFFAPSAFVLTDSPILVGKLRSWRFAVDGVPHRVVYWPLPDAAPFDTTLMVDGLRRLVTQAARLFGRLPYREYVFQLQDGAVGGLEHLNSVTMGARSVHLAEGLTGFFAEAAHEYVHTWNLMRLRPVEYGDVRYRTPPRSRGLWWSEGLTIYYSDLLLRRSGLPTWSATRLNRLESLIARYVNEPGNLRFSAESVSVVAYGGTPQSLGGYEASTHTQGELLGAMLDFEVRGATSGRRSLEEVMLRLLDRFSGEQGFTGRDIEATVAEVCGCRVTEFFDRYVRAGNPMEYDRYLRHAGLRADIRWVPSTDQTGKPSPDTRVYLDEDGRGGWMLVITNPDGAWGKAGLRTGDRLVSINGTANLDGRAFRQLGTRFKIGDTVRVVAERGGRQITTTFVLPGFDRPLVKIVPLPDADASRLRIREDWTNYREES